MGRALETGVLERHLAAARAGSSSTLVVSGEAGIGKSALLAEARRRAAELRVLTATGTEAEQDLPFAGLHRLLRPLLPLLDRIPAPQADALSQALALRAGGPADRFAVSAATLSLVCRAAEEHPLLLVVDDVQLLDPPSRQALLFTARRLLTDAVVMLLGIRTGTGADDLVADLEQLPVRGLALADTGALVAEHGLSADQVSRVHQLTAGNPLAALEMSSHPELLEHRAEGVPVPRLIVAAFAARCARLAEPARRALLLASVADTDLAVLARACTAQGLTLASLAEAERLGLVVVGDDRVEFRHPLLRAAVYQGADPGERRTSHRAVAAAIGDEDLDRRAWHLSQATLGPDPEVAAVLVRAAESARGRGAFTVAASRLEQAARLAPEPGERATRLVDAGEAAWLGGLGRRATELLDEAAGSAGEEATRLRAVALSGVVSARCGELDEARDRLLAAAAGCAAADPDEAILLLAECVYACFYLGDTVAVRAAVRQLDDLADRARSRRSRLLGELASGMGLILGGSAAGDAAAGARRVRTSVEGVRPGDFTDDPRWLPWLLLGPIWLRESGDARRLIDEEVAGARERAALGTLPFLLFHAARDDATTDRWAAAEAGYREAIALARETGMRTDEGAALAGLSWVLARQSRESETRAELARAEQACRRSRMHLGRAWLLYALGDLEAGLGNTARAVTAYRDQLALLAELGISDPDVAPVAELVECLVRTGEPEAAAVEARAFHERAAAKGQPWSLARAHRALAVAGVEPDTHFPWALAEHAHTLDVYERARTQLSYGAHLRRTRRRVEARPVLREALAGFDRLAATPWAQLAAVELGATGERVQRRSEAAPQALTSQEFQIATLLAAGRTTREGAAALFLSPKTVEYHLRHVYLKLAISSRRELAERLASDPELRARRGESLA